MSTIYVPTDFLNNCNEVYDGFIRSYTSDDFSTWVDIYPDMNYALKVGSTSEPQSVICDTLNVYTDEIYYRFDICDSLIIFVILGFVMFFCVLFLWTRLFKRFSPFR